MVTAGPPSTAPVALLLAAGALLLLGRVADAGGRVLAWPAAALLAGAALRDLLLRPVLSAGPAGLQVVTGLRRRSVPWSAVERLRVVRDRRTPLLEIDLGDTLVVLSRFRLGRPPEDVLSELSALQR